MIGDNLSGCQIGIEGLHPHPNLPPSRGKGLIQRLPNGLILDAIPSREVKLGASMERDVNGDHQSVQEKGRLKRMIRSGRMRAQAVTWARILFKTDEGWTAARVAVGLGRVRAYGTPDQAPVFGGGTGGGAAAPCPGQPMNKHWGFESV